MIVISIKTRKYQIKSEFNLEMKGKIMYIISRMSSGKWFGECFTDDYYCEGAIYFEVSEQMIEHEKELNK